MTTLYLVVAIFGAAVTALLIAIWLSPGSTLNPVALIGPVFVSLMCFLLWNKSRSRPK